MARQDDTAALTSFLYGGNTAYVERLAERYRADPSSVDPEWAAFFAGLKDDGAANARLADGPSWKRPGWPPAANGELVSALDGDWGQAAPAAERRAAERIGAKAQASGADLNQEAVLAAARDSVGALMLIRAYRVRGHLAADLDPLKLEPSTPHAELDPASYGFGPEALDRRVFIDGVLGLQFATPREMVAILQRTYCRTLGVEFMHISDPAEKAWLQERIEGKDKEIAFTPEGKRAILGKLVEAEGFESFIDVKYTGTKRFGLDGGESMIPALEQIIKRGGAMGAKEIVLGMAHRGRLNVLSQVMGKPHRAIFHEFKGGSASPEEVEGSGDVKYHLGASSNREFDGNHVHLSLAPNPSHLEIVDPVVLGKVRAKQDQHGDTVERTSVMPLLIHGDAAFAGQGVVAECLGLSGLKGHRTGGSLHFIVNNQIGFTTDPRYSRSSPYPSDLAKMVEAPIFHANGDDPEAVVFAAKVATEFRQLFRKPRRGGHVLLPPPRPQRGRRAGLHPAAHVQGHQGPPHDAEDLLREARSRGRHRIGRDRRAARRLAGEAGGGVRGGRLLQAQPGRLARRPLGQAESRQGGSRRPPPRRDRRGDGGAQGPRPGDHGRAGGLRGAPHRGTVHGEPPQDGRDRPRDRLVHGRGARLRLPARGRAPGAALGAGRGARHLLAAPLRADRPANPRSLHPAEPPRRRAVALRGRQLDAVRGGGARVRIRLHEPPNPTR